MKHFCFIQDLPNAPLNQQHQLALHLINSCKLSSLPIFSWRWFFFFPEYRPRSKFHHSSWKKIGLQVCNIPSLQLLVRCCDDFICESFRYKVMKVLGRKQVVATETERFETVLKGLKHWRLECTKSLRCNWWLYDETLSFPSSSLRPSNCTTKLATSTSPTSRHCSCKLFFLANSLPWGNLPQNISLCQKSSFKLGNKFATSLACSYWWDGVMIVSLNHSGIKS